MLTVILACQIISFKTNKSVFILHLPSASAGLASGDELSWPQSTPVRIWTTRSRLSDTRSASLSPVSSLWTTPRPDWLVMTVTFKYSQEECASAHKRVNNPDKQEIPHNAYSKDLFKKCGGFGGTSGCYANCGGDRRSSFKLSTFRQTSCRVDATYRSLCATTCFCQTHSDHNISQFVVTKQWKNFPENHPP